MKITCIISACLLIFSDTANIRPLTSKGDSFPLTAVTWSDTTGFENRFTLHDAEKILGEKARPGETRNEKKDLSRSYTRSYSAISADTQTGKLGNVGVMFELYNKPEDADAKYDEMLASNRNSPGVKILNNIGDEAWSHGDGSNFYLIIIRKGNRMFRMKVNKVTSKTSIEEFNRYAAKVAETL